MTQEKQKREELEQRVEQVKVNVTVFKETATKLDIENMPEGFGVDLTTATPTLYFKNDLLTVKWTGSKY